MCREDGWHMEVVGVIMLEVYMRKILYINIGGKAYTFDSNGYMK